MLKSIIKTVLPASAWESLKRQHREWVFHRSMSTFIKNPQSALHEESAVLQGLIYGWGNESWSALTEYLVGGLQHAMKNEGPVLECGSGLSTILLGVVAQQRGHQHWALEHTPAWAERVQACLNRYQINAVKLIGQPLKAYGDFDWYGVPLEQMPKNFSLVICDGPPAATKGGRYGLIPVMRRYLAPGAIVLLDDAARIEEQTIAQRWAQEVGGQIQKLGQAKPYICLTLPLTAL
jgi:hypothetical protein